MLNKVTSFSLDESHATDVDANIFGLNCPLEEANVALLQVPWEATVSYGKGTALGPKIIHQESSQLDLFSLPLSEFGVPRPWEYGIHLIEENAQWVEWNEEGCKSNHNLSVINDVSKKLHDDVQNKVASLLQKQKIVGIIGGEHSVSLGALKALAQKHENFGILHFDAHCDLRVAYEGYSYSHASIMYNALRTCSQIKKCVQVGIRDFCEQEYKVTEELKNKDGSKRVVAYFDHILQSHLMLGTLTWAQISKEIVSLLPENIYISFDIDGLDPTLCSHTGTPVPGGLSYAQAQWLLLEVLRQKKKVIGFDLVEVAANEKDDLSKYDGNVAARILYLMCGVAIASHTQK